MGGAARRGEAAEEDKAMELKLRLITDEDLGEGGSGAATPALQNLRPSHHTLARLMAKGLKQVDVSAITGFSQSRISILKRDPAFGELLEHYAGQVEAVNVELLEKVKLLAGDALAELHGRLDTDPEGFSNGALLELVKASLDRSGVGPKAQVEHKHLHLGAEDLAKLREAAQEQGSVVLSGRQEAALAPAGTIELTASGETTDGV